MKLIFFDHAWDDYLFWQKTDKKIFHRINDEHRFVYKVTGDSIHIAQLRYHY